MILLLLSDIPELEYPISPLLSKFASYCTWRPNTGFISGITVFVCAVLCVFTPGLSPRLGSGLENKVLSCFGAKQLLDLFFQLCILERPIQYSP